uniref:Uncharacterized protein n=1 Tax=Oryza punctata TaxID=4537 RepID=A0A0E0LA69_ORYPU
MLFVAPARRRRLPPEPIVSSSRAPAGQPGAPARCRHLPLEPLAASSRAPAGHPDAAVGSGCAPYPAASSRTPAATASPPPAGQPGAARSLSSLHLIVLVPPKPQRSGCGSSSLHFLLVNTRAAAFVAALAPLLIWNLGYTITEVAAAINPCWWH